MVLAISLFAIVLEVADPALQAALLTVSSVYLGFWLAAENAKVLETRKAVSFLIAIAEENRSNAHYLEQCKANFSFYVRDPDFFEVALMKLESVQVQLGCLMVTAYDAFVSSSLMSAITEEDLYNALLAARINIADAQSTASILSDYFRSRVHIQGKYGADPAVQEMLPAIYSQMEEKMRVLARDICLAIHSASALEPLIASELVRYGVSISVGDRLSGLNKDDEAFVEGCIRKSPPR